MFESREDLERRRASERNANREQLPKEMRQWLDDLAREYAPAAKQAAAARDKAIKDAARRAAPHVAALEKARGELDQARAWLANVPFEAEPSEIATQTVIRDQWPARVNQLAAMVAPFDAEKHAAESEYQRAMRDYQQQINQAVGETVKRLQVLTPQATDLI